MSRPLANYGCIRTMLSHIATIVDKSTIQSLTKNEAHWLHHHFMLVIPPVFFSEVLGDVGKRPGEKTTTGTGVGDARMLAGKIESHSIYLNAEAMAVVRMELLGQVNPPDGRPILEADVRRMPSGEIGAYVDSTPMQEVLERWKAGDFDGMEKAYARVWRDKIGEIDLEEIVRTGAKYRNRSVSSMNQAASIVDAMINAPNQNHHNIRLWMRILGIPERMIRSVLERWKASGRPDAVKFIPYTYHMARVKTFFTFCVTHQIIGTRKSNVVDLEYIDYLPFCKIFSSGDNLHAEMFPFFSAAGQFFLPGRELKAALSELVAYYENMPDELKRKGSYHYAKYPPLHMQNAVTAAYDNVWPEWRDWAVRPSDPPRSPEEQRRLLARLEANMKAFKGAKRSGA